MSHDSNTSLPDDPLQSDLHPSTESRDRSPTDAMQSSAARPIPPASRKRWSFVWEPANGHEYIRDGTTRWRCSRCPDRSCAASFAVSTTKNAINHLRNVHRIGRTGQLPEMTPEEQIIPTGSGGAVPPVSFNHTLFRQMLVRWITTYNIPFQGVDNDAFRHLLRYHSASSTNDKSIPSPMPTTGTPLGAWILQLYMSSRDTLRASLNSTSTSIHITFDSRTSPEKASFLAIFGHYVELKSRKCIHVLLGLRKLQGPLSGANQAGCIWQVATELGIAQKLGYFTTKNTSANNKALEYIAEQSDHIGVTFDPISRRIQCFGQILDEIGKALLWGESPEAITEDPDSDDGSQDQIEYLRAWRRKGPLGRLHNCIRHILTSPQTSELFQQNAGRHNLEGASLLLISGDGSSWREDLAAISRALLLRDPIDDFIGSTIIRDQILDECSLAFDELSSHDWDDLTKLVELFEPVKMWTIRLQKQGAATPLSDILPAYEELLSHFDNQMECHSSANSPAHTLSCLNAAWLLLREYVAKIDKTSAYYASVALNPQMKFDYFENEWGKWPAWIEKVKNDVVQLWKTDYEKKPQWVLTGNGSGTTDFDSEAPPWLQRKRARLARDVEDPMEQFQQAGDNIGMGENAGPVRYWLGVAAGEQPYGGRLARMGLEFGSIPGLCTEAKWAISSGEHTYNPSEPLDDDIIEAIECLKSWSAEKLIFGTGTEVAQMEKLLQDIQGPDEQQDE